MDNAVPQSKKYKKLLISIPRYVKMLPTLAKDSRKLIRVTIDTSVFDSCAFDTAP